MATSPLPFNFLSVDSPKPSSNFLYPVNFNHGFHFLSSSRVVRLKIISCSSQTIEKVGTQEGSSFKKKRKPKPSFLDKIQEKWSVKTTSLREKLPWQEEESGIREETVEHGLQNSGVGLLASENDLNSAFSEPVVKYSSLNRTTSPPWAQESKPRISHFDSEVKILDKSNASDDVATSGVLESEKVIERFDFENDNGLHDARNDGTPLGLSQESQSLVGESNEAGEILDNEMERFDFDEENRIIDVINYGTPLGLSQESQSLVAENNEVGDLKNDEVGMSYELSNVSSRSVKFPWESGSKAEYVEGNELKIRNADLAEKLAFKNDVIEMPDELNNVSSISVRLPWESESKTEYVEGIKLDNRNVYLAEKLVPEPELKRLRNMARRMVERIKVGEAGVTQALVHYIHKKWKMDEVVKLKFEGAPAKNMRTTHELLESRTGGLVIWRSGSLVVLYRGMGYKLDCVESYIKQSQDNTKKIGSPKASQIDVDQSTETKWSGMAAGFSNTGSSTRGNDLSPKELNDLQELNLLLDELGPRYESWSGREPLPVDADLLPASVPGFKGPVRHLPYGIRHNLRDKEMTSLRQTAKTVPPHFALGRNRQLQGLASAMVKLWEKSAIAKIAIKRGVQNTSNERMAEELKVLTGGTLMSRNKEYIVFYRGNDFLPSSISEAVKERKKVSDQKQDEEEKARQKAIALIDSDVKPTKQPLVAGTLSETKAATTHWSNQPSSEELEKMMKDAAVARHASLVKFLESKLATAKGKITLAEKALRSMQANFEPADLPTDLETLTDEERFLFRKIGLSMKTYLPLGRRGLFDGTIENMHLHWKYKEVVKVIVDGRKRLPQVKHIAVALEAESGGVLVSVDRTMKGYAIIVYRGKNYQKPAAFRPKNLLSKRQALSRAIELQRREGLKHHVSDLQEKIKKLKADPENMKLVKEIDEQTLYSRIDDASDDDDNFEEDEYDKANLDFSDSEDEDGLS